MIPLFTTPMFAVWRALAAALVLILTGIGSLALYMQQPAASELPQKMQLEVTIKGKNCD